MIITLHRGEEILTIEAFTISVTCLAIYPNISADRPRIKLPAPNASSPFIYINKDGQESRWEYLTIQETRKA